MKMRTPLSRVVREKRRDLGLTQIEFSKRVGVGLRLLRSLEQEETNIRLDKVIQILNYLGLTVGAVPKNDK